MSSIGMQRKSPGRAIPLPDHEWQRVKPIIESEYKKKTLEKLITFMANEHNFLATPQQYKGRIRLWRLGKYIRREEMDRLVSGEMTEKASNGKILTHAQKQRSLKRMSTRTKSDVNSSSPASWSEGLDSDTLSPSSQVSTPVEDYFTPSDGASPDTINASFHSQSSHSASSQTKTLAPPTTAPSAPPYPIVNPPARLTPTLGNFYSRLYEGFDQILQQNASEILMIKQIDVHRWTNLHFAILWHLIIDAWPSAISHSRYPIDNQSWKWFFETDLTLDDVFGYIQTVPATFSDHHAFILAALFTVRFWTKSGVENASVRSHSKPFCVALAILATKRAVTCLYNEASASNHYHREYTEESLSGLATDHESAVVHSDLMKTIACDLTANKFALWENDIFQSTDYLRCKMRITTPALRSSDACDVLQKYLPHPEYAGLAAMGPYADPPAHGFANQDHLMTDMNHQDIAMAL